MANLLTVKNKWSCRFHGTEYQADHCTSCRRNHGGHNVKFTATFDAVPTDAEVADAQQRGGYAPAGYGGPFRIDRSQGETVTWYCPDNCE